MQELVERLNKAAKAYYQDAEEIMSNYEYDKLYDELLKLEKELGITLSNSPTVNVGYEVLSELPKERHERPMLSLDKTKEIGELEEFVGEHETLMSWKMDGLTIVLTYRDGELYKAVTRGNGEVGEVVTANARVFRNVPLKISYKGELILRGEAVIGYKDFEKINEEIANNCYLENQPLDVIMDAAEKRIFELAQHGNSQEYTPIKQVVLNALEVIEKASKTKGTVTGIPTGFIDLDYKLSGLQRSDLILVAARPSMGKTAFVLNIAQHVAFRQEKAVAIFSLEMSKEQLVNRLFSLEAHVDAQILRTGNLKDSDWEKLIEGAGTIGKSKLIIDDTSGISITEMRSKCRKYKLEHGLDLIIIDYLQLMSGSGGRSNESRQQEISEISRSLKGLARELNVPVIALSQLSRAVEQRTDKRPMLSDLRESGAIEQDADVCMFIYREDYYIPDTEDKNIAEIIIAKQRNGPVGTVRLAWMPQYTRFGNELRQDQQ